MAAFKSNPTEEVDVEAWTALAAYVVPPEIVFKEWYLSSSTSAHVRLIARGSAFPNFGLLLGSRTEALSVPDLLVLPGEGGAGALTTVQSDYDSMFPIPNRFRSGGDDEKDGDRPHNEVDSRSHSAAAVPLVTLDQVAEDPRYYRLLPSRRLCDVLRRRHPSFDGGYLPDCYFTVAAEESSATKAVGVHGPAVYIVNYSSTPSPDSTTVRLEQDLVDSIQLDAWPAAIAADWLRRARPSGWPDERLARDLIDSAPLLLTPTGRPGSPDEAIEWRLSFSLPERRLALSLTAAQRTAYVLVKMLMKAQSEGGAGDGGGGVAVSFRTFYLKNALFWACETEPADAWRRPANGARMLLAHVERYATDARLPSFFAPASNLLDREPAEALQSVAARARHVRERPLNALRVVATTRRIFMSLGCVDYGPLWRWVDSAAPAPAAMNPDAAAELQPSASTSESVHFTVPAVPAVEADVPACQRVHCNELQPAVSPRERALLSLFAAYANLLKQVEASVKQQGDCGQSVPTRVMHSSVRAVTGRLAVDVYCCKHRQRIDDAIGDGCYVLSSEMSSFVAFLRSLLEEYGIAGSEDLVLHSLALLKNRLRSGGGGNELSSGSFAPVTECDLRLMTTQCALLLPSAILGMIEGKRNAA